MLQDGTHNQSGCRKRRRGSRLMRLLALSSALVLHPVSAQTAPVPALPYLAEPIQLDGRLDDWPESGFVRNFAEPDLPSDQANHVQIRLAWNSDELLIAGILHDQEWHLAPPEAQVDQFHHYDSLQVYIDPRADSNTRMNGDDIDLLLLPDGRFGVLRGDDLVAELAKAQVPQRESAPLAVRYVSRRDQNVWYFELAIPFAGMGVSPESARPMKLDVAMNDWLSAQPLAPGAAISRAALLGQEAAPPNPAPTVGRDLWPLTWTGQRDFGFPAHWQLLQRVGGPDWIERLARQLGVQRVVLGMAALSVLLLVLVGGIMHWRNRRHLRALIARLAERNAVAVPVAPQAEAPNAVDAVSAAERLPMPRPMHSTQVEPPLSDRDDSQTASLPQAQTTEAPAASNRDRLFAERVADYIRRHVGEDLNPQTLADALHVSVRTLQRHLREGLDTSPQELLLAIRLETAAERLRDPNRRIQEVAFDLGFQDLSHFSRRFRAAYGCTPSAYQQRRSASPVPRPN